MSQYNKLLDQTKTGWANKQSGPNTKLGGPVPNRPTRSATTGLEQHW